MAQYRPCFQADEHPPLDRSITSEEYRQAFALADKYGLLRLHQGSRVARPRDET